MMAQWGTGAIQVIKQAHELGLKKHTKIWFDWMTNVFGSGVPAEALEGVYSMMSWYWNLEGFADPSVVAAGKAFVAKYTKVYGDPPDPYAGMAYVGCKELIRGIEQAQSTDPMKIAKAIMAKPTFPSMKGRAPGASTTSPCLSTAPSWCRQVPGRAQGQVGPGQGDRRLHRRRLPAPAQDRSYK